MSTLSIQQVGCYAIRAGFTGNDIIKMVVIAKLESGFRTDARNPTAVCTATECGHAVGLWQVVDFPSRVHKYGDLTDPVINAHAAYDIFRSQGLTAWSTWTAFLAAAVDTAAKTSTIIGLPVSQIPLSASDCANSNPQVGPSLPGITDPIGSAVGNFTAWATALLSGGLGVVLLALGVGMIAYGMTASRGTAARFASKAISTGKTVAEVAAL